MHLDNPQLARPFSHQCLYPSVKQRQLWVLVGALHRGERLTFLDAVERYGIAALSQRIGQLRNEYLWPIKDAWRTTNSGAKIKEYFL